MLLQEVMRSGRLFVHLLPGQPKTAERIPTNVSGLYGTRKNHRTFDSHPGCSPEKSVNFMTAFSTADRI